MTMPQDSKPPKTFETSLPDPNWLARLSKERRRVLEYILVTLGAGFFFCQLYLTRMNVLETALAEKSPVTFEGLWVPDRDVYRPGDVARFTYLRGTDFDEAKGPLLALSLDAFENKTTGEVFEGALLGRVIDHPGRVHRVAVRMIPQAATAGEYQFEGWMRAETPRRTVPVAFRSKLFRVVKD